MGWPPKLGQNRSPNWTGLFSSSYNQNIFSARFELASERWPSFSIHCCTFWWEFTTVFKIKVVLETDDSSHFISSYLVRNFLCNENMWSYSFIGTFFRISSCQRLYIFRVLLKVGGTMMDFKHPVEKKYKFGSKCQNFMYQIPHLHTENISYEVSISK